MKSTDESGISRTIAPHARISPLGRKKSQVFASIRHARHWVYRLINGITRQRCKCLTCTLEEEFQRAAPQNLLQGITKRMNEHAVSVEKTNAHLRANIRLWEYVRLCTRAHTYVKETRMTWIGMSKRKRKRMMEGQRERGEREREKSVKKEREKKYMCVCASGCVRERESNITAHTFIGSMGIYWSGYWNTCW